MKKTILALVGVALCLTGCNTAASVHQKVFGCWPQGYTPPPVTKSLDAVGEDSCGKPVYGPPACSKAARDALKAAPACPECEVK